MSLPLNSNLAGYNSNGGIYENTNYKNDIIVLNIRGNEQSNSGNNTTEFNQTKANLQLNNNKIIPKSVTQRPNQIFYYDNTRENQYPASDNLRNQLNFNDKNLKLI